jgi:hypothetical protein
MYFSKIAGTVTWSQGTTVLRRDQTIEEDHPLRVERPDLFTDEDPGAEIRGGAAPRVQTTMQRPGETRTEKGPIKRA